MTVGEQSMPMFQDENTHQTNLAMSSVATHAVLLKLRRGICLWWNQAVVLLSYWTN